MLPPRANSPVDEMGNLLHALLQASRYELKLDPSSLARAKAEADNFSADQVKTKEVEAKFIQLSNDIRDQSGNMEYALTELRTLLPSYLGHQMRRPIVHSFEVGTGSGKTASEIGIAGRTFSHATGIRGGLRAYESMIRDYRGHPNVYGASIAEIGPGFYAAFGEQGIMRKSDFNFRFTYDSNARAETDFGADGMRLLNRNAARFRTTLVEMAPAEYFSKLLEKGEALPVIEGATLAQYRRTLQSESMYWTQAEESRVLNIIDQALPYK